jgi:hypothetical protein
MGWQRRRWKAEDGTENTPNLWIKGDKSIVDNKLNTLQVHNCTVLEVILPFSLLHYSLYHSE